MKTYKAVSFETVECDKRHTLLHYCDVL